MENETTLLSGFTSRHNLPVDVYWGDGTEQQLFTDNPVSHTYCLPPAGGSKFTHSLWFSMNTNWVNDDYIHIQGLSQFYIEGPYLYWGINTKSFCYKAGIDRDAYIQVCLEYYDIDENYLGNSAILNQNANLDYYYYEVNYNSSEDTIQKDVIKLNRPPVGTSQIWLVNNGGSETYTGFNIIDRSFVNQEGYNIQGDVNLPWIGYPLNTPYTPPISTREDWGADQMPKRSITFPNFYDDHFSDDNNNLMYFAGSSIHSNTYYDGLISFTKEYYNGRTGLYLADVGRDTTYADHHITAKTYIPAIIDETPFPNNLQAIFPPPVGNEPLSFYNGIQELSFIYTDENNVILHPLNAGVELEPGGPITIPLSSSSHAQYRWGNQGIETKTSCDHFPVDAYNTYQIPANATYIWLVNSYDSNPIRYRPMACKRISDIPEFRSTLVYEYTDTTVPNNASGDDGTATIYFRGNRGPFTYSIDGGDVQPIETIPLDGSDDQPTKTFTLELTGLSKYVEYDVVITDSQYRSIDIVVILEESVTNVDADWIMLTYFTSVFTEPGAEELDLDTRSRIVTPNIGQLTQPEMVGWGEPQDEWPVGDPYPLIQWGGDNVNAGFESILIDVKKLKSLYNKNEMVVDMRAIWYDEVLPKPSLPVVAACTLWKGGQPQYIESQFIWENPTATNEGRIDSVQTPILSGIPDGDRISTSTGWRVATYTYNLLTGESVFDTNDTVTPNVTIPEE